MLNKKLFSFEFFSSIFLLLFSLFALLNFELMKLLFFTIINLNILDVKSLKCLTKNYITILYSIKNFIFLHLNFSKNERTK